MSVETQEKLRDGDIFRWRWKDEDRHHDCAPFRAYHCKSRIAVAEGGLLFDTYWSMRSSDHVVKPEGVILTHLGNMNDMTKIQPYQVAYYKRADIVDMRHANSTRGPIYLKTGAARDADMMRQEAERRIEEAQRSKESAVRTIKRMREVQDKIEQGDLGAIYF